MSKRTLLILSIVAIVLGIIGWVAFFAAAAGAAASGCASDTSATASSCVASSSGVVGGALIGTLVLAVAGLVTFVTWILGLIKTAKISAWGWFVLVLLLTPLGTLIYSLAGPEERAA